MVISIGHSDVPVIARIREDYCSNHPVILGISDFQASKRPFVLCKGNFTLKFDAERNQTVEINLLATPGSVKQRSTTWIQQLTRRKPESSAISKPLC